MARRQRWNPIPSVVYGVAFGVIAGGLVIWGTNESDRWQDHAGVLLEITTATTFACVAVSYLRQFFVH
jgi:hypothetical protein